MEEKPIISLPEIATNMDSSSFLKLLTHVFSLSETDIFDKNEGGIIPS